MLICGSVDRIHNMNSLGFSNQLYVKSESLFVQANVFVKSNSVFTSVWPDAGGEFATEDQFLRPDADISAGSWTPSTGTDLFAVVNETTADDSDYMLIAGNQSGVVELGLPTAIPLSGGTRRIIWRMQKDAAGGNARNVTVSLYDGSTLIQTDTTRTVPDSWTEYTFTVANTISNWDDLRIQMNGGGTTGGAPGNRREIWISYVVLELLI